MCHVMRKPSSEICDHQFDQISHITSCQYTLKCFFFVCVFVVVFFFVFFFIYNISFVTAGLEIISTAIRPRPLIPWIQVGHFSVTGEIYGHLILINHFGSMPRNSVDRLTDQLDMTLIVFKNKQTRNKALSVIILAVFSYVTMGPSSNSTMVTWCQKF